jgi:hypothetical protein
MSNDDSQLLMQASQIAGNLRERVTEQTRRESHIADQLASLDQEQRLLRMAKQQLEEDRQDRDAALKRREGEFASKLADAEKLLTDLQTREVEVARGHEQLEIARTRLAEELAHQLDVDRAALRHAKQVAEAERQDLAAQSDKLREEHQSLMRQVRRDLEVERRRVRAQTASDIEAERAAFEGAKAEWTEKKALEESVLKREAEVHRQAVVQIERDLAAERQNHLAELERRKAALVTLSEEERASVQREREELQNEIAAEREELKQAGVRNVMSCDVSSARTSKVKKNFWKNRWPSSIFGGNASRPLWTRFGKHRKRRCVSLGRRSSKNVSRSPRNFSRNGTVTPPVCKQLVVSLRLKFNIGSKRPTGNSPKRKRNSINNSWSNNRLSTTRRRNWSKHEANSHASVLTGMNSSVFRRRCSPISIERRSQGRTRSTSDGRSGDLSCSAVQL